MAWRRLALVRLSLASLMLLLVSSAAAAQQTERVLDFRSDVTVASDGSLTVTEEIAVYAAGREIKRGILRDFPTTYTGRLGNTVTTGFEILEVTRDGRPEPYATETLRNGVRVRIGDKDVFLDAGRHVYGLTYRTDRQLGFFEAFDELYWNVTGNDWTFVIERASVTVRLPDGADIVDWAAYTGRSGEQGRDFRVVQPSAFGSAIEIETTRPLAPGEGFTVAVAFPKGHVAPPTQGQKAAYFFADNAPFVTGAAGLLVLLGYFLAVWASVGRDPKSGPIVPHYVPPDGISPAAARYVTEMGYDDTAFTAAVVNMAVKGYLRIEEADDGDYTLVRADAAAALSPGERALAAKLFSHGVERVPLARKNYKRLQKAQKALRDSLKKEFEKLYFLKNTAYFLPGAAISLIAVAAIVLVAREPAVPAFLAVWLSGWTLGCYMLLRKAFDAWRLVLVRGKVLFAIPAVFISAFSLPFLGAEAFVFWEFAQFVTVPGAVMLALILLVDALFFELLKAPTRLGRKLLDRIEGFALYLSVAEKDRLNFHNPPERTPELFERFLSYALALGVEQAWGEQFAGVVDAAARRPGEERGGYRPAWYRGRGFSTRDLSGFASGLGGGFAGAVASASRSPGSSSGSGGGGSSGGGGGGGGGSGW
jgi:uncharacterized membrane protein YgcG